jgi:hypothetical protein
MDVTKTLNAGAPGTKRYQKQYGANLVCVRYRKDETGKRRLTTVEIIVDDTPLQPPRPKAGKTAATRNSQRVLLRIGYEEGELRERIKQAGGWWLPKERLWRLPFQAVEALNLHSRVVRPAD